MLLAAVGMMSKHSSGAVVAGGLRARRAFTSTAACHTHQRTRLIGLPVYRPQMRAVSSSTQMATMTAGRVGEARPVGSGGNAAQGGAAPACCTSCAKDINAACKPAQPWTGAMRLPQHGERSHQKRFSCMARGGPRTDAASDDHVVHAEPKALAADGHNDGAQHAHHAHSHALSRVHGRACVQGDS